MTDPKELSPLEWQRDEDHRAHCADVLCGDIAHWYRHAYVDGQLQTVGQGEPA